MEGERWSSPVAGTRTRSTRTSINKPSQSYTQTEPEEIAESTSFAPPEWRRPWHRVADLGYPDYLPPRPGQEEDEMTDVLVKNGFKGRNVVTLNTESFVGHNLIHDMLVHGGGENLDSLATLLHDVFERRNAFSPAIGSSTFKMPSRAVLSDSKREAWISSLADPNIPLGTLAQEGIVQSLRGHDLMDMLHTKNVPIQRAVWYVRVLGANETLSQRTRPNFNPSGYSIEWANIITSYLKRQIGDIVLPSIQRAGVNMKANFKSVLSDPESRNAWASRFAYTLSLLREFFPEGLVDHSTFLCWLSQQPSQSNLAQCNFIAGLSEEYFDGLVEHRGLIIPFIKGCLTKISEIDSSPVKESLQNLRVTLSTFIQRSFLATPDCFVSPGLWMLHSAAIKSIVFDNPVAAVPALGNEANNSQYLVQGMRDLYPTIESRNLALQFRALPERAMAAMRLIMADIQTLNSIDSTIDIEAFRFFTPTKDEPTAFANKLDVLLTWSVSSSQYGDHRPYATCTILAKWLERAIRRNRIPAPAEMLQDLLFRWLDTSDMAKDYENNLDAIALLYGRLIEQGLFSYGKFIQTLMARGETGQYSTTNPSSHLLILLHAIPIISSSPSLMNERKAALYGMSKPDPAEQLRQEQIRAELKSALPQIFGATVNPYTSLETLSNATRFEKVWAIRHWLMPILKDRLAGRNRSTSVEDLVNLDTYSVLVHLLSNLKCVRSLFELNILIVSHSPPKRLLAACIDTFRRFADLWASMDANETIQKSLLAVQQDYINAGIRFRPLSNFLSEFDHEKKDLVMLTPSFLAGDDAKVPQWRPQGRQSPNVTAEISALASSVDEQGPSKLARNLWYLYHDIPDLGSIVWDNVVHCIQELPRQIEDPALRQQASLRYANLLFDLGEEMPTTLDDYIAPHMRATYPGSLVSLDAEAWQLLVHLFLNLILMGGISVTTVLQAIVYPTWFNSMSSSTFDHILKPVNLLTERLLLFHDIPEQSDELPPRNLTEVQRLQSQSEIIFRLDNFTMLLTYLPVLGKLELTAILSEGARNSCTQLRVALCQDSRFRLCAFRHVDLVRDAFLKPARLLSVDTALEAHLVDTLRLIVRSDGSSNYGETEYDMQTICSRLNPWAFSRSAIELQLTFKRLCDAAADPGTRAQTERNLDKFTTSFLGHTLSPGETDLVADVLRGISGPVAEKFVNRGMERLTQILSGFPPEPSTEEVTSFLRTSSEVLRLLASVIHPLRDDISTLPNLEPKVRGDFVTALQRAVSTVDSMLPGIYGDDTSSITEEVTQSQSAELVVMLARLSQFLLGFREGWSPQSRDSLENILAVIINWAIIHGGGLITDAHIFPLLLDTAGYILDELPPKDPKTSSFDLTRQIPNTSFSILPAGMPQEFQDRIRLILPYAPRDTYVSSLVHVCKSTSGAVVFGKKAQAKPWDWIDYTNVSSPRSSNQEEDDGDARHVHPVKNDGSISFEYFSAQPTGEMVQTSHGSNNDQRAEAEIRMSENRIHGETIFERDWKESRILLPRARKRDLEEDNEGDEDAAGSSVAKTDTPKDSALGSASPAPSAKTSWSSQSQRRTAEREVIDVDALPAAAWRGAKRKASNSGGSEERVIVEDVVPPVVGRGKGKGKGKVTVPAKSTRSKK